LVIAADFRTLVPVAAGELQQIAIERRAKVEEFQRKHRVGLLTLLFTDVVDSVKLKQALGEREAVTAIQQHHAAIREILGQFSEGEEIETAGDSFFIVFTKPSDAVQFSLLVQARLRTVAGEARRAVLDRIGIHVGEVWIQEHEGTGKAKDLYGIQVDTCARVQSLGQADQILLTRFPFDAARQALKGEKLKEIGALSWLNHGPYVMKGVEESLEICEVGELGKAKLVQPVNTEKAYRFISPDSEPVLGWRPAVDQPVPGTGWVLEKKLGEGGFGEVWLGRDKRLKTERVFKFCFRADRVRSLKREVTLFRLLKERVGEHPNIVRIEHVYFDEAPFYIVMQHVEGEDLATWYETQGGVDKVPLAARIEIVAQIADALQAAHDSGVIHRDVKPSNILVGGQSDTHAYLTDFGIGQVVSDEVLSRLTHSGFTQTIEGSSSRSGTQLYMAPELFSGRPASIRSDVYALGVVLYQLVVGDFSRAVTTDWARRIPDPLLREDLEKCFAGDPQERFACAGQLAAQLRCLKERRSAYNRRQALRKVVIGSIVAICLLSFGLFYRYVVLSVSPSPDWLTETYLVEYTSYLVDLTQWTEATLGPVVVIRTDDVRKVSNTTADYIIPFFTTGKSIDCKPITFSSRPKFVGPKNEPDRKGIHYDYVLPIGHQPAGHREMASSQFTFPSGFTNPQTEWWESRVAYPSKTISVVFRFPANKPAKNMSVSRKRGDEAPQPINDNLANLSDGGRIVKWVGINEKSGSRIHFEWDW
jgi:serine/threonine protein kinase/class 3 adenylate cyclase